MNNMRNKIFSLLVLLMTAATGAWADDYYLVGNMNDWGPSSQFHLTQNPGNPAEYMITLTFKAGDEFKVIGVDGESNWTWFPAGDGTNYYVSNAGEYTVYFRPDGQGDPNYWHHGCIFAAAATAPAVPVTDLGNNTWQFTMPDYAVVANIEYDTDLELREENTNTTVLADWDGYEAIVTLTRTLKAGSWNTLTLPYDIPAGYLGLTAKELTDATLTDGTLNLTFTDATIIKAGKPYLVKVNSDFDFSTQAMANVTVSKTLKPFTSPYVDFVPTLGKTLVTGPEGDESNEEAVLFLAAGNKLVNPTVVNDPAAASYMKGFRAYFRLKGAAVNAASFNLDMGDGETTSINSIENGELRSENYDYFNLSGQRVGKDYKGIVIMNGKKIVVK